MHISGVDLIHENGKKLYRFYLAMLFGSAVLELILAVRGILLFDLSRQKHRMYLYSYVFLFLISAEALAALLIWNRQETHRRLLAVHAYVYAACFLLWSAFVSCVDFVAGGDSGIMVYIMAAMAVGALLRLRPGWYLLMLMLSAGGLLHGIWFSLGAVSPGFCINLVIFLAISWFIALQGFRLGLRELESVQKLTQLSITDQLTGTYNRRYLDDHVQQRCEAGKPFCFILLDVDNFKSVNDVYGHAVGDFCLALVAKSLRAAFGEGTYRFGGDEFVVITEQSADQALEALASLNRTLAQAHTQVSLQVSAGLYPVRGAIAPAQVFLRADKALYEAKSLGKAQSAVYEEDR